MPSESETFAQLHRMLSEKYPQPACPVCGTKTQWVKAINSQIPLVHVAPSEVDEPSREPTGQVERTLRFRCNVCGFVRLHAPRENP